MSKTFIGPHPPQDDKEHDCQCARCGSSCYREECADCYGEGYYQDDDDVDDFDRTCLECNGDGGYWCCGSDYQWCKDNPMPGRENQARDIEWFVVATPTTEGDGDE